MHLLQPSRPFNSDGDCWWRTVLYSLFFRNKMFTLFYFRVARVWSEKKSTTITHTLAFSLSLSMCVSASHLHTVCVFYFFRIRFLAANKRKKSWPATVAPVCFYFSILLRFALALDEKKTVCLYCLYTFVSVSLAMYGVVCVCLQCVAPYTLSVSFIFRSLLPRYKAPRPIYIL